MSGYYYAKETNKEADNPFLLFNIIIYCFECLYDNKRLHYA